MGYIYNKVKLVGASSLNKNTKFPKINNFLLQYVCLFILYEQGIIHS